MEIKEEKYHVCYEPDNSKVICAGSLMLNGTDAYEPILQLLKAAAEEQSDLTLDLQGLKFLNSSGINMMTKFVVYVHEVRQLNMNLSIAIASKVAWQQKLAKNMKRLMPSLDVRDV